MLAYLYCATGCYQLHPHHCPGIITPDLLPVPIYRPPKGWIAWLAKADCMHITFAKGNYTIESKGTRRNPGCRVQDKLNTNEPTAPYIIGREFNLKKTARSVVGVEPTTFRTAATDDDRD